MLRYAKIVAALGIGLVSLLGYVDTSKAQQNPVTAIDIALEPDATMIQHAQADNARLLKAFPKGFALDATHHPHVTMLQRGAADSAAGYNMAQPLSAYSSERAQVISRSV